MSSGSMISKVFNSKFLGGFIDTLGGTPVARDGDSLIMRFWGKGLSFSPQNIAPVSAGAFDATMSTKDKVTSAASLAIVGATIGMGFADNGLFGALSAVTYDTYANRAIHKVGYSLGAPDSSGIRQMTPRGPFGTAPITRGVVGNAAGYLVGSAIGGLPGFVAGNVAAYAGARWGGTMAIGAAGLAATGLVAKGAYSVFKAGYQHQQLKRGIHTGGSLAAFQTQGAFTMRERAVQAIHKSHMNARSALGQEASLLHRPQVNYSSRYRV